MTVKRHNAIATGLASLAVLVVLASQQAWGVPLVGESHRWAAVAVFVLGLAAYFFGEPLEGWHEPVVASLGIVELALAILALATGSLVFLWMLVATIVAIRVGLTVRHARHGGRESLSA
jgi:hypothetical protein